MCDECSIWIWLRISKEEFERQVLYGSCVKCGQTARNKDSCLCIKHTRSYHSWQTRMSKNVSS